MKFPPFLMRFLRPATQTPASATATAAAAVTRGMAKRHADILAALALGPQTAFEVSLTLGEPTGTVAPRMSELKSLGYIAPTGDYGTARTPKGRAMIWQLVTGAARPTPFVGAAA